MIGLDFVVVFPHTLGKFDSIWVVVNTITKLAHFFRVTIVYNTQKFAKIYVKEIVRLHRMPHSIISNCGTSSTICLGRNYVMIWARN